MARIDKDTVIEQMKKDGIRSHSKLAEELKMDYRYLNKLLNGKPFNSTTLQRFADRLQVHPGEIVAQ